MKKYIPNIIVVEGSSDSAFISSHIDALIVTTNGYEIPKKDVEFLNNERNKLPAIILTDSDEAGKKIRERLNALIKNKINIEIDIKECNKNNKHGVAESTKEALLNALKEHISEDNRELGLNNATITRLGIDKDKRDYLCKKMSLGICNNKTFINRANYLKITEEELQTELKENGNK